MPYPLLLYFEDHNSACGAALARRREVGVIAVTVGRGLRTWLYGMVSRDARGDHRDDGRGQNRRREPPDPSQHTDDDVVFFHYIDTSGHGRRVSRSRIERLMRRAGLRGLAALPRRVRTTDSSHGYPIAPNRLGRDFRASSPNQVWLADLTYVPTGEGWLYLAAILDMHTRKLVGWSIRQALHAEIALDALDMAIERQRPAPGLIHHSDSQRINASFRAA